MKSFAKSSAFTEVDMLYVLIFLALVLADQLTKAYVDATIAVGQRITVWDGVFSIANSHNSGAAFSMLAGDDWAQAFFIVVTIAAIALALGYVVFSKADSKWLLTSITLILAGAIGNFIDRLAFKSVRDFLWIEFFANCNVADVAITVGAIMLFIYLLFLSEDALFMKRPNEKT